jgi:parvulin-like peptidyl-prolyl isomerase
MASKGRTPLSQPDHSARDEFIRRFKANPFVFIGTIVVLVIVIIAFVLVPAIVPSAEGLAVDLTFGSYDRVPIAYVRGNYFAQVQANYAQYMQSMISGNIQSLSRQIWRTAFEETVIHTAMLQEMKRAGYETPPGLVDEEVAKIPEFQENGQFSAARYRRLDRSTQLSIWKDVRDSMIVSRYSADLAGLRQSSREAPFISAMASTERSFDMAVFPLSSYPDSEISAFARDNAALFTTLRLSKITVNASEREIQQIRSAVEGGSQNFEEAARTHSQDAYAESGGDIGSRMAYELAQEIPDSEEREAVRSLAKGSLSPVVKVPSGWAFYRAEEDPVPVDLADPSTVEKVRTYLIEFERGRMDDWLIAEAEGFIALAKERGFDAAIEEKSLAKQNFGPVPMNYGDLMLFKSLSSASVSELSGAESNENFWRIAFSTPLKSPSTPLIIGDNALVLCPLEETAAEESALENINSSYSSYWVNNNMNQSIRTGFLESKRLENHFDETFTKYFEPLS